MYFSFVFGELLVSVPSGLVSYCYNEQIHSNVDSFRDKVDKIGNTGVKVYNSLLNKDFIDSIHTLPLYGQVKVGIFGGGAFRTINWNKMTHERSIEAAKYIGKIIAANRIPVVSVIVGLPGLASNISVQLGLPVIRVSAIQWVPETIKDIPGYYLATTTFTDTNILFQLLIDFFIFLPGGSVTLQELFLTINEQYLAVDGGLVPKNVFIVNIDGFFNSDIKRADLKSTRAKQFVFVVNTVSELLELLIAKDIVAINTRNRIKKVNNRLKQIQSQLR